jgi:ferric-dicitrate binding protein FerR (iron transport regulator)
MIDPSNDEDLDALLGGGRLTGPAQDRIFDAAAAAVAREPRPRARRRLWTIALTMAGAAAALVVVPRIVMRGAELRSKGDETPAGPQLGVACIGGTLAACPRGATLMFGASGAPGTGYLAAYAEPVTPGLERIWYFSAEGESPRLTVGDGTVVAQRAVRVGPEHAPGRYRIHLVLGRAPASQAAVLSGGPPDAIASREIDLRVTAPGTGGGSAIGGP